MSSFADLYLKVINKEYIYGKYTSWWRKYSRYLTGKINRNQTKDTD
ncbi:MAG: hypothetical protein J5I59_06375 [Saprospiraceae bacterium]|nr:hypothetical protein [Saprospiraceae bacterium]